MRPLRIATRASALAMAQARECALKISAVTSRDVELVEVITHGDVNMAPLASMGGVGVFASAVREAVLNGECDLAVHSAKDLPSAAHDGLAFGAFPEREDVRDVLVSSQGQRLHDFPAGARIGTGSPRRVGQVRALAPDLDCVGVRGNLGTRLRLVDEGVVDAIVLAAAGLVRLGLASRIEQYFSVDDVLPAGGQGALALETRADDLDTLSIVSQLDHAPTRAAVTAERAFLAALGAGCSAPVAAYARLDDDHAKLTLSARVLDPETGDQLSYSLSGSPDKAVEVGQDVAHFFLMSGELSAATRSALNRTMGEI